MKVWKKVIIILADFEDYLSYKLKGNKKKEKYDQLELDIDNSSKSPEKITFFSNLKRDFVILVILALIGTIFISINKNTKHAVHLSTLGVQTVEFQNCGLGGTVSMTVDQKEDIKNIFDEINKIEKEKDIDVIMDNVDLSLGDGSFTKIVINYKNEKKEPKIIEVHDNKIINGKEEVNVKTNSFSSLWYKLNYKVTNVDKEN